MEAGERSRMRTLGFFSCELNFLYFLIQFSVFSHNPYRDVHD